MATSSIFVKVRIDDPKQADAFVDALAAAENKPKRKPTTPVTAPMTDINEIKKFMSKRFPG